MHPRRSRTPRHPTRRLIVLHAVPFHRARPETGKPVEPPKPTPTSDRPPATTRGRRLRDRRAIINAPSSRAASRAPNDWPFEIEPIDDHVLLPNEPCRPCSAPEPAPESTADIQRAAIHGHRLHVRGIIAPGWVSWLVGSGPDRRERFAVPYAKAVGVLPVDGARTGRQGGAFRRTRPARSPWARNPALIRPDIPSSSEAARRVIPKPSRSIAQRSGSV